MRSFEIIFSLSLAIGVSALAAPVNPRSFAASPAERYPTTTKDCDTKTGVPTQLALASPVAPQDVSSPSRSGDSLNNAGTVTTTTPESAASTLDVGGPVNVNQTPSSSASSDNIASANAASSSPSLDQSQLNAISNPVEGGTSGDFSATSSFSNSLSDAVSNQAVAETLANPSGPTSLNPAQPNNFDSLATTASMPLAGVIQNEASTSGSIQNGVPSAGIVSGFGDPEPLASVASSLVTAGLSATNSAMPNNVATNLDNISLASVLDPLASNAAGVNALPPSSLTGSLPVQAAGSTAIVSDIVSGLSSLTGNNALISPSELFTGLSTSNLVNSASQNAAANPTRINTLPLSSLTGSLFPVQAAGSTPQLSFTGNNALNNAPSEMSTMRGAERPSLSPSAQIITGSMVDGNCICTSHESVPRNL